MVKFFCYFKPSADTTQVLACISAVEVLQHRYQRNLSKLEIGMKKLEAWKADMDNVLKNILTKIGML